MHRISAPCVVKSNNLLYIFYSLNLKEIINIDILYYALTENFHIVVLTIIAISTLFALGGK